MAAPTITLLNHQLLDAADANTNWTDLTTADTDIKVEGNNSMSGIFRTDGEQGYADLGSAPVTAAGKTLRGWILTNNLPYMGTMASDPYKLLAYDGSTTELKNLFGSDTYPGGWFNFIWDMDDFTTLTLANVQRWGVEAGHASNAKNAINTWMDAMRYLDGYSMTGGTSGDKVRLSDIATYDKGTTTLRGYGVITEISSVFFCTGTVQFGTGATTHYFEMDGQILVFKNENVASGLYSLSGIGSGTDVVIKNSVIRSAGSTDATRFVLDFDDSNLASFLFTDNLIVRASTIHLKSGQTATGNVFDDCDVIYAAGADMDDCIIKNFPGTSGSSALVWDVNTDPDGYLDNQSYTKGTATAHAIEFGTTSPTSMTIRGIDFSGYNASNGQADSTLHIRRTSGTVTISAVGCTGNISYLSDGATVIISVDPVTTSVHVQDSVTGANIQNARVLVTSGSGGPFPYQDGISIVSSGSTATVTHTAHGMASNDYVVIKGATQPEYNGVHQITKISDNSYSYTISGSPASPATGSPVSTYAPVYGLSDANGNASGTKVYSSNQPVEGSVRKASSSPYYAPASITGTIDKNTGLSVVVQLIEDD